MKTIILLLLLILSICSCQINEKFEPTFKSSNTPTHKIPEGQDFTFGYLEVPENRNNLSSNTIRLPVYIFKSRSPNPKPDPIIYTVGGPGSTTMPSAQYMNYYKYLDDRDFILVEQRGTQFAQPNLACPEWSEALYYSKLPSFDKSKSDSLFNNAALTCRERLVAQGIDLNGYNTNEIAADIEDLRKTLGMEKYNLLTISYSTKIAQVLLRDYPEAIRSVVMDSPLPLEVNYDEESVSNLLEAIDKLLWNCETDNECSKAFPNLKELFYDYLRDKTQNPLVVTLENPNTGKVEVFYLEGKDLITVFTSASIVNVPMEINKLLNNDLSSIKKRLSNLFKKQDNGDGKGMRLSVWCAEEFPFVSQSKVEAETNRYPEVKGLSPSTFQAEVCEIWGVKKAGIIENEPIKSGISVLLISGEYDEATPPKWAAKMGENLSNSYHLIFKGWKHTPTTNWSNQCAMQAANDFFNNPSFKPIPDCFNDMKTPQYLVK